MIAVPANSPVTTPLVPTRTFILVVLHVPPPASVNAVVAPTHSVNVPVIAAGNGFTVTIVATKHPVDNV